MVLLTFMFSGWFVLSVLLNAFILGIAVFITLTEDPEPSEVIIAGLFFIVVCLVGFMFVKSWICIFTGLT